MAVPPLWRSDGRPLERRIGDVLRAAWRNDALGGPPKATAEPAVLPKHFRETRFPDIRKDFAWPMARDLEDKARPRGGNCLGKCRSLSGKAKGPRF